MVPRRGGIPSLRRAAADCQGCPLYQDATATVFGEGLSSARIVLVGEQPGDQEDRLGEPFVGQAGHLLRKALAEAGIDEKSTYLTNAVKHFKFSTASGGKRRIHKAPNLREMTACRPWLMAELKVIDPDVGVALGATAGKALLGTAFRVSAQRGMPLPAPAWDELGVQPVQNDNGHRLVATLHPSAVLRANDREAAYAGLVSDLRVAASALRRPAR
ncbi:UdgX family uracil-DNA binding protein [Streptomyces sp. NRRL B-24720]|uniref:UdgX family uracil-DNA binding protein n=1 Tax=Streptomyces sp. NRRL B-24720 TaxID=1476876 RepID=UPI00068ED916|nr:UdgX family uracil-DNA binding protein [Streptomyces sp. NRRL B-24720]